MNIKRVLQLKTIYAIAIPYCLLLILKCGRQWDYDTDSYVAAWETISSLHLDLWRTPVYPLFIGLTKYLFGSYFLIVGTVIQHLIFLISIRYFYKLAQGVVKSERSAWWATAFYALYPCVATWNCFILTEPFAIYSMIFMLYCALTAYQKNSVFHLVVWGGWLLFQIFLRPAQIYILPVFFVGWLLLYLKKKRLSRIIVGGVAGTMFASCCMLLYIYTFKNTYGVFTPCGVGIVNKYYMARRDGTLIASQIADQKFRKFVEERNRVFENGKGTSVDLFKESQDAVYTFGLKQVSDVVSDSSPNTLGHQVKMAFQRFRTASNDHLFTTFIHKLTVITDIFGVRINFAYYLLLIYPLVLLRWYIKIRDIPWFSSLLFMVGASHMLIIIVACQNIWGRLVLPVVPVYIIMFTQLCHNALYIRVNRGQDYC